MVACPEGDEYTGYCKELSMHDVFSQYAIIIPPGKTLGGTAIPAYRSITEALEEGHTRIFLSPGIYREKLFIGYDNVQLIGSNAGNTMVVWDDAHRTMGPDGKKLSTSGSASVTVTGRNFRASGVTFANDFDYPLYSQEGPDSSSHSGLQAVAVRVGGNADNTVFQDCIFSGYQDTLFLDAGTARVKNCTISGHVDFIFGRSEAVFEDCTIICRYRDTTDEMGFICAPSTHKTSQFGFLFLHCNIKKESKKVIPGSYWLGRPWHPSGDVDTYSSACFYECSMDGHIKEEGWTSMHSKTPDGIERRWYPEESRFSEYGTTGRGAPKGKIGTRPILDIRDATVWLQHPALKLSLLEKPTV